VANSHGIITVDERTPGSIRVIINKEHYYGVRLVWREENEQVFDEMIVTNTVCTITDLYSNSTYLINAEYLIDENDIGQGFVYESIEAKTLRDNLAEYYELEKVTIDDYVDSQDVYEFYLEDLHVRRYKLKFVNSGIVHIATEGSVDTFGILNTNSKFDELSGVPVLYDEENSNDDSDEDLNFALSCKVEADTVYYLWVCNFGNEGPGYVTLYINPPKTSGSISKWSWSMSNGSATDYQTWRAYQAVVNKTAVKLFAHLVWNDLCDKVKEIVDMTGDGWDSTYATFSNTKMTDSDKTLTATKFNSLRYNIGSRYSTGISEVDTNDAVLGSYFITLALCINEWIDTL
jgi:hypothetical protein